MNKENTKITALIYDIHGYTLSILLKCMITQKSTTYILVGTHMVLFVNTVCVFLAKQDYMWIFLISHVYILVIMYYEQ